MSKVAAHDWIELPHFVFPTFNLRAIGVIAPIAIVTCVEHVGDIYANGAVVGKDFTADPGLHRTMLGRWPGYNRGRFPGWPGEYNLF